LWPEARAAMAPYLDDRYANASSLYAAARETRKAVEEAREIVAAAVGARPDEVVFTSGGTEADNIALQGVAVRARNEGRDVIVVSAIEHHAVLDTARWLGKHGFRVTEVPVDADGVLDVDALADAVDRKTAVVSVMYANNEVGTIQPVGRCAEIARAAGARFHTDAVQALPWLALDSADADLIALAAHKVGGPKGVGALGVASASSRSCTAAARSAGCAPGRTTWRGSLGSARQSRRRWMRASSWFPVCALSVTACRTRWSGDSRG